jgi:hypothetical protein
MNELNYRVPEVFFQGRKFRNIIAEQKKSIPYI